MKYELTLRPSPTSSVIPVSPNAQYPLSAHQTVAGVERSLANLREQLYETEAQPCLRLPRRYLRTSMMRIVLALISRPDRMMAFHDQRHDGRPSTPWPAVAGTESSSSQWTPIARSSWSETSTARSTGSV